MTETAGTLPEPAVDDIRLVAVLHALADPVRLRIIVELAGEERGMNCQAFNLPVTKSTSTHHFRVLREAGLIRQWREGTSKINGLRAAELAQLFPGLLEGVLQGAYAERERGSAG